MKRIWYYIGLCAVVGIVFFAFWIRNPVSALIFAGVLALQPLVIWYFSDARWYARINRDLNDKTTKGDIKPSKAMVLYYMKNHNYPWGRDDRRTHHQG